ncbi:MAG: glycoside hydrolase family 3 N-terminal domain-containing protein [Candidatus Limnocylindrales bacterium]
MSQPASVRLASRVAAVGLLVLLFGVGFFAWSLFDGTGPGQPAVTPSASAVAQGTPSASASASATALPTPGTGASPSPAPTAIPSPSVPTAGPTARQLIGQKLVIRMDGTTPGASLLRRVRRGEIGGVVLFKFNVLDEAHERVVTDTLQDAARAGGQPPLLIMADQEGGEIRTLRWAPPMISASAAGAAGDTDAVRALGVDTASALRAAGVNADLAPVADVAGPVSFMANAGRTYGSDPEVVAGMVTAFADGLRSGDVLATLKHFPGIGRVALNTDRNVQTVTASRDALERDLLPFRRAIADGVPIVMLSNATYTAWDPDHAAGWSRAIAVGLLRDELEFTGVSITDSLNGTAASRGTGPKWLAAQAARAGTDMIMMTGPEADTAAAFDDLVARAQSGWLDTSVLRASYDRILALKATLGD